MRVDLTKCGAGVSARGPRCLGREEDDAVGERRAQRHREAEDAATPSRTPIAPPFLPRTPAGARARAWLVERFRYCLKCGARLKMC